jgi:hypothetical protein
VTIVTENQARLRQTVEKTASELKRKDLSRGERTDPKRREH